MILTVFKVLDVMEELIAGFVKYYNKGVDVSILADIVIETIENTKKIADPAIGMIITHVIMGFDGKSPFKNHALIRKLEDMSHITWESDPFEIHDVDGALRYLLVSARKLYGEAI